jgi:hypothetical protein
MNHTSQKWPEFGGFSQLRSPFTGLGLALNSTKGENGDRSYKLAR